MSNLNERERPVRVIESVLVAIDLYWDFVLEFPQNILQITCRESEKDGNQTTQEVFTIQRVYDTAYYIKCVRSGLSSFGGKSGPVLNAPEETIEYRFLPDLLAKGKVNITHTDIATGISTQDEPLIDHLAEADPTASTILRNLQINLLAMLVQHCKNSDPFDPNAQALVTAVKSALRDALESGDIEELWRAGMS